MDYFLKLCGRQELGSVAGGGAPRRGRYLLVSQDPRALSFFPPLSSAVKNDFCALPCIPLYLDRPEKIYLNFVYHNDKFHGSAAAHPRNEYRLYLSREMEGGALRFREGDIVLFRKGGGDGEEAPSPLYVDHVPKGSGALYDLCRKAVEGSDIRGGYAVRRGALEPFERKVKAYSGEISAISVDEGLLQNLKAAPFREKIEGLFNRVMFRDFLLAGYEERCAVSRAVIRYRDLINIEAAHIVPRSQNGSYLPGNGLMLSRDLHWAFDKGFFSVSDEFAVIVHPKSDSAFLAAFEGKRLFLPVEPFFRPDLRNIRWHREHVYGLFCSGERFGGAK